MAAVSDEKERAQFMESHAPLLEDPVITYATVVFVTGFLGCGMVDRNQRLVFLSTGARRGLRFEALVCAYPVGLG